MFGYLILRLNKKSLDNTRGSLLLEALLATVILSVSITIIIHTMVSTLRSMTDSARYTMIVNLLENKMIELIQSDSDLIGKTEDDFFPEPNNEYRYSLITSSPQAIDSEYISEARIKVSLDTGRRTKNVELTTYIFNENQK